MKRLKIDIELLDILKQIQTEQKTIEEWRKIESCDMFQSKRFCGGFDAIEDEFTFSYYDANSTEHWFQLSLNEIDYIMSGNIKSIELNAAK